MDIRTCESCFNKIIVQHRIDIPKYQYGVREVVKISIDVQPIEEKVIRSRGGRSIDGYRSTPYKLIMIGSGCVHIDYMSCEDRQGIYSIKSPFIFPAYVTLPPDISVQNYVKGHIVVEHIHNEVVRKDVIYIDMMMIVSVDVY